MHIQVFLKLGFYRFHKRGHLVVSIQLDFIIFFYRALLRYEKSKANLQLANLAQIIFVRFQVLNSLFTVLESEKCRCYFVIDFDVYVSFWTDVTAVLCELELTIKKVKVSTTPDGRVMDLFFITDTRLEIFLIYSPEIFISCNFQPSTI